MPAEPRWLADEMLGRLSRYLRFMGHDTEYVHGLADAEVVAWARRDGRTLLTRDVQLASRVPGSRLLLSGELPVQIASLRDAFPEFRWEVRFDRCTECNGHLSPCAPAGEQPPDAPHPEVGGSRTVYECLVCRHRYWEGTHTAAVRRNLSRWLAPKVGP